MSSRAHVAANNKLSRGAIHCLTWLACSLLVPVSTAQVEGEVDADIEWNLGIGVGAFEYHLYPGAKNTNNFVLPAPYFTYRSEKFEIDRGIKSFIYDSELIIIDISADFNLPVDSNDTVARQGMPDLDLMLQAGPSVEFLLNDARRNYFDARLEIPLRAAIVSDFTNVDSIGFVLEPRFSFAHRRHGNRGLDHKFTVGIRFGSRDFHAYYYDVQPEFVTPERSAFSSRGGFGGSLLRYKLSYRTDDFVYWVFARYQSLAGAEFEDSPLVVQKDYTFLGIGFSWIFASSFQ